MAGVQPVTVVTCDIGGSYSTWMTWLAGVCNTQPTYHFR